MMMVMTERREWGKIHMTEEGPGENVRHVPRDGHHAAG